MTQKKGELVSKLSDATLPLALSVIFITEQRILAAILMAAVTVITIVTSVIVDKKTVLVKSIADLDKSEMKEQIGQTVEGKLIDEVCTYAIDKGLNPAVDFAPTGPMLNTFVENRCIGICELLMPAPGSKYMSDSYKAALEEAKENIDKFVVNNPTFVFTDNTEEASKHD